MTLDTDLKFRRQNANYRELETSDKQILKFTVAEFTAVTVGAIFCRFRVRTFTGVES